MPWRRYIAEVRGPVDSGYDEHNEYVEYECRVTDEIRQRIVNQLGALFIPSDDAYIDTYLRQYADGGMRIRIGLNEDFSRTGFFVDQELELGADELDELSTLDLN